MVWLARVDLDVINTLAPQATRLGDALTALAAAALTLRARVVPHVSPWTLIGQITHGRLLAPARAGRAGLRSPLLPGPRAPAAGRHRDDAEPACARPAPRHRDDHGATVTTTTARVVRSSIGM